DIVYFALERSSNTGDGNVGIWFLQDPTVSCLAPASGPSTSNFTGNHFDGDLLVVAAFTTGGAVSTVNVYEWTGGNAAGHLNPTPIITGADCARSPAGDPGCAIVNSAPVTPPWPTQDKDGNNILDTSEFFEGGVDLTRMRLAFGCSDGNSCPDDSGTPTTRCGHPNNTASCDDGNACTLNDRCSGGVCVSGLAPNCDDGNVCTDDTCNPSTGCVHTANTAPCNDGNACTTNDTCSNGGCVGGPAMSCDDGNACTDDTCNSATGCVHTNNTAACSDGNSCTVGDVCSGGRCVSGTTCGFVAGQQGLEPAETGASG